MNIKYLSTLSSYILLIAVSGSVSAEGLFEDLMRKTNFSSFVRLDTSYRTSSSDNLNNQLTNPFNKRDVERQVFLPPPAAGLPSTDGNDWAVPLFIYDDTVNRGDYVPYKAQDFNYFSLRAESEIQIKFTRNFRFVGRVRGVYEPDDLYEEFNPSAIGDPSGNGLIGGRPELYEGMPNYYEAIGRNGKNLNPLEWAGQNFMIDLPALMLEYRLGNLTLRAGNQQIAWGQAIFFQTLDIPNGLDLRRHSVLDRAFEEFSDKRVPKLAVRATYQLGPMVADAYVGKFQPLIFGNPNTPLNVIPSQFTVDDNYHVGGYDNELDFAIKLKTDYGQWGWQLLYSNRMNPNGTFRWAATGVNTPFNESSSFGALATTLYNAKLPTCDGVENPTLCRNSADPGEMLSKTPFAAQPGGVVSAEEWFTFAADVRLDGVEGINAAVEDFPDLRDIWATEVQSVEEASALLNTYFVATGGLRGFLEREYHREDVFGAGLSYVTESDNEWLNQIIFNLEVQYAPDRVFTSKDLGKDFHTADEYIASLVVEKWTRWTAAFPAAYLVAQFQHRSESDIVGRHLSGYGATPTSAPTGIDSANYVVLAALQPWPGRKYILELAALIDVKGGMLFQPLLQYNMGKGLIGEIYYNYINGEMWGNPNDNLLHSADWADELAIRLKYQF